MRPGQRVFVGRDWERAELEAALDDARGRRGRLILVTGEPGIGKTALAENFAVTASAAGARVVLAACREGGGAPPFLPWTQILRGCLDVLGDAAGDALASASSSSHLIRILPEVADHLDSGDVPGAQEPGADRFLLFDAVTTFLRKAAAGQPLALIMDDLHAADLPSLLLLRHVALQVRSLPLVLLGTFRDTEGRPEFADVVAEVVADAHVVALRGLDSSEVASLIEGESGRPPTAELVAAIDDATHGNPLFIREMIPVLAERAGRGGSVIGEGLRAVIRRRLAPLSADAIQALVLAAVIGRDFELSVLERASDRSVERALPRLQEALDHAVLVPDPSGSGRFRFSHGIIREVLYDSIPMSTRVDLHRRVGEAIEEGASGDPDPRLAELAHHFSSAAAGGQAAKALDYVVRAGDRALAMGAFEEAAVHYERGLGLLDQLHAGQEQRCDLLLRLGGAWVRAGDFAAARIWYAQAAAVARKLGDARALSLAALGFAQPSFRPADDARVMELLDEALRALRPTGDQERSLRAQVLARASTQLAFAGEAERMDELSGEALALARGSGDPDALAAALRARWTAAWEGLDRLDERAELAGEILDLARRTGDREIEAVGQARRVAVFLERGDGPAMRQAILVHTRLAEELGMPFHLWVATTIRAMRAQLEGRFAEAERLSGEGSALQRDQHNAWAASMNLGLILRWQRGASLDELLQDIHAKEQAFPWIPYELLAFCSALSGRANEARAALDDLSMVLPGRPRGGTFLSGLSQAVVAAAYTGDPGIAVTLYQELAPYAGQHLYSGVPHPVTYWGSASLHLGLLAATMTHWDVAVGHLEYAIEAQRALGAAPFMALAQQALASVLRRRAQGQDRRRAPELRREAQATVQRLEMGDLEKLLGQVGAAPAGGVSPADLGDANENVFRREGDYWTVSYDGRVDRVRDSKGLAYLARLLGHPGREFHVLDLAGQFAGPVGLRTADGMLERRDLGNAGELLDSTAKAAYRARVADLRQEIEDAAASNDPERRARAERELDFLTRELARAVGLGGRDRVAASHTERARLNVSRAVKAALDRLSGTNPSLGEHLRVTVRTGTYCSYRPDPRTPIRWAL